MGETRRKKQTENLSALTGRAGAAGETCQVAVFTSSDSPLSEILTRRLHRHISDVSAAAGPCRC